MVLRGVLLLMTLVLLGCKEIEESEVLVEEPTAKASEFYLKNGYWKGSLVIDSLKSIPFLMGVYGDSVYFINGKEKLGAVITEEGADYVIEMPIFDSKFTFSKQGDGLDGKWNNYAKGKDYEMHFVGHYLGEDRARFEVANQDKYINVDGKWEVDFSSGSREEYKAVGLFEKGNDYVSGTFLTETGDYRFLEGVVRNDSLLLSCFDGAHAFLFEAQLSQDTMHGTFYSGKHHQEPWRALKNEGFELSNPDSLTRLKIGETLAFSLPSVDGGEPIVYPSTAYNDKVVIIQVMGSWCPNCMDETALFTQFYETYHDQGLEVIAVAFEKPEALEDKKARVQAMKKYFNAGYDYAIGGKASKVEAQQVLPALESVLSFPTAIFIDKTGQIRKIHTGFYGPSTGTYYLNYVKSTKAFLEQLLSE